MATMSESTCRTAINESSRTYCRVPCMCRLSILYSLVTSPQGRAPGGIPEHCAPAGAGWSGRQRRPRMRAGVYAPDLGRGGRHRNRGGSGAVAAAAAEACGGARHVADAGGGRQGRRRAGREGAPVRLRRQQQQVLGWRGWRWGWGGSSGWSTAWHPACCTCRQWAKERQSRGSACALTAAGDRAGDRSALPKKCLFLLFVCR